MKTNTNTNTNTNTKKLQLVLDDGREIILDADYLAQMDWQIIWTSDYAANTHPNDWIGEMSGGFIFCSYKSEDAKMIIDVMHDSPVRITMEYDGVSVVEFYEYNDIIGDYYDIDGVDFIEKYTGISTDFDDTIYDILSYNGVDMDAFDYFS